jgi:hypothetical protein
MPINEWQYSIHKDCAVAESVFIAGTKHTKDEETRDASGEFVFWG